MKINLIPCPDCGSSAELKELFFFGTEQSASYVHCTNPDCDLYCHCPHFTGHSHEENDEHAALSWNERYAETVPCQKAEFEKLHPKKEHETIWSHILGGVSWDKVLPFR